MKITWMDISKIEPYFRNPRKNEKAVAPVKESIMKFGFRVPIILDKNNIIVAGHTRYKAVLELKGTLDEKLKEIKDNPALLKNLEMVNKGMIPTIPADDLTEKQIKEYRIVDNRTNELSEWDTERLKFEIRELDAVIGYSDDDLKKFLELDVDFDKYTDSQIDEIKKETEEHISEKDTDMVEMICPACGNNFYVSKSEVNKKYTG